jgi:hypothetical protein
VFDTTKKGQEFSFAENVFKHTE